MLSHEAMLPLMLPQWLWCWVHGGFERSSCPFFQFSGANWCYKASIDLVWQRTHSEPCNLTHFEGIIQSSNLLHALLSGWWDLDNILSTTKASIVVSSGWETARGSSPPLTTIYPQLRSCTTVPCKCTATSTPAGTFQSPLRLECKYYPHNSKLKPTFIIPVYQVTKEGRFSTINIT